jgi:hypothetical protein
MAVADMPVADMPVAATAVAATAVAAISKWVRHDPGTRGDKEKTGYAYE